MGKPNNTGITRIINALGFSKQGLQAAWMNEAAFRQELILAVILFPLAFFVGKSNIEIAILVMTLFIVVIAEIINSALEAVVDRISDEQHELAGRAKDMGSAAVFLALMMTAIVWLIILFN